MPARLKEPKHQASKINTADRIWWKWPLIVLPPSWMCPFPYSAPSLPSLHRGMPELQRNPLSVNSQHLHYAIFFGGGMVDKTVVIFKATDEFTFVI